MSVLSSIRTYILSYSGLATSMPLWVNFLGPNPTGYSINPLPGTKIVETYLDGSSLREFPFSFQSMESTADDLERIDINSFYETFSDWMESQTLAGVLPILATGKTAESIETLGWAYLYEQGQSETGIYQTQCKIRYAQVAPS